MADSDKQDLGSSPTRIDNPLLRLEAGKALVWGVVIGLILLAVYLAQSLMVIFGAMVFGALIDGGARLLERVLPIGRGLRVAIVLLLTIAFILWLGYFAGSQLSQEAAAFPQLVREQFFRAIDWLEARGFDINTRELTSMSSSLATGVGTVTQAIGGVLGGLTTLLLIVIIGIYLAVDPNIYERGAAWMIPARHRDAFFDTFSHMAKTLRRLLAGRLLGMVFEGVFVWLMLAYGGTVFGFEPVPMAALLGILTGLLAFIPNIGAIISGVLITLVGFSAGTQTGIYAFCVYVAVQNFDGYVIVPMIAKKTVDLAPALVLSAQLIFGVLFGILGLALADPLLAMIKVALERRSARLQDADDVKEFEPRDM